MAETVEITINIADEGNDAIIRQKVIRALRKKDIHSERHALSAKKIKDCNTKAFAMTLIKRSIDARGGRVKVFLRYEVAFGTEKNASPPNTRHSLLNAALSLPLLPYTAVIVGTGPSGLFAALTLLQHGIRPILIDRGEKIEQRKKDIASISKKGIVNSDSNYCFGEGGAGTFSDGKLYTRSGKRGNVLQVFETLVEAGADPAILTDSHPHIGTDRLPYIVDNIVNNITSLGGECRFHTRCTSLIKKGDRVYGIITKDTHTGEESEIRADAVLLATGHSAKDIYTMLYLAAPASISAKGFAVGVRVEHPRALIDAIQYHGQKGIGAAEYRLTAQVPLACRHNLAAQGGESRGVYSFCMCPGGFIVPSDTSPYERVINGMSNSKRNSKWSNSAIVMEVRVGDEVNLLLPDPVIDTAAAIDTKTDITALDCTSSILPYTPYQPNKDGGGALSLLIWRTMLEREAYYRGCGQKAPAQRLTDFLLHKNSASLPPASYTPGITASRLDEWLPRRLTERLETAFKVFDNKMKGFITEDALLIAPETRTSSPVRITRDENTLECPVLHGLYAAGEGAGYAGGITSSAIDGEKAALAIVRRLKET